MTTRTNGAGIGLAICRKITEDHGGDLELKNNASGALLILRFPTEE